MKSSMVMILGPTLAKITCSGAAPDFVHPVINNANTRKNPKWEIHFMAEY